MLLLSAGLALAEDLTTVLALDDQRWTATWADVRPGPLPSVVLKDDDREVRVDLTVVQLAGVDVVLEFVATEHKGKKKPKMLWQGRIESHEARSAAIFASQGKDGAFQIIAASTAPELLPDGVDEQRPITTGPLAGCQWMRRAEATVVSCSDAMIFHRSGPKMDAAAISREVVSLQARVGEDRVSDAELPLIFGTRTVPGHRLLFRAEGSDGVMITAWFDVPTGTDQVGCMSTTEAVCATRMAPFVDGLPAALK